MARFARFRPATPLTFIAAEEVAHEIKEALNGHRNWLKNLEAMLVCRSRPGPGDLRKNSHLHSEFGRWISGKVNPYIRRHPKFKKVGVCHRQMHKAARRLAKTVHKGRRVSRGNYRVFVECEERFRESVLGVLAEARELLRYTDPLTGIANRYVMLPRLEQERERIKRSRQPCSVAMMDLDRFKVVNDTYGHHVGDRVLQGVAQYLLDNIRRYDRFYRYGGEEFVLMLPNTSPAKAKGVLDRLRRGLKLHPIPVPGPQGIKLYIRASFGVAALDPALAVKRTIKRADKAMYAAKAAGRDRVHVWTKTKKRAAARRPAAGRAKAKAKA